MTMIWVPNVSEGRDTAVTGALVEAVRSQGVSVLDVHSDALHHRSVITATGGSKALVDAAASLAETAADVIDLRAHEGRHPRMGALDVSPFVPHGTEMEAAVEVARASGRAIHERTGIPIYLYGEAATRARTRELPELRRGGLEELMRRAAGDLPPDLGSAIDPRHGVVCVGARGPLIAFNVWLNAPLSIARAIARAIRGSAVRALGIEMSPTEAQVSVNLIDPGTVGIDRIFERISGEASIAGAAVTATEIVGLVPAHFMPDPDARAARLLREPGRSLESVLAKS